MGFKNWFFGNVSGPKGYGYALGRDAREAGAALSNVVFMSHGIGPNGGPTTIFDTTANMIAAGFTPRFQEITEIDSYSLTLEEQLLFRNLQMAMISFAYIVNSNGALNYMRRDNTSKFRNGFGPSFLKSMVDQHLYGNIEEARAELLSYIASFERSGISSVLNIDKPACGDLLEHFIFRAVKVSGTTLRYGFTRTGLTGFDVVAVPLVVETLASIADVTLQLKW